MTVTNLRVKVLRQPIIRAKFIPWLPATIVGRTGISVERDGLNYLLDLDYSKFFELNAFTPADKLIAVQGRDGIWNTTSIETLRHQIGADNPNLVAISGAATATDKLGWWSDTAQYSLTDFTSYMRSLLDDPDASTARATLGLVIGTDVQPHDAELDALAGLVSAADKLPYFTGPGAAALTGLTSYARSLLDDADAATARATLGLVIGTDVQAHDSDLDAIAALTPADNDFIQRKAGAWVNRSIAQVKTDLAISNVDNTSDLNKPISTATQGALDLKADKSTTLSAGTGLTGGGDLSANRSIALDSASVASLGKADTAVQPTRSITAGTGLTGGGDLSANRTIALDSASIASLGKADTAVQPADLAIVATTGDYLDLSSLPTLGGLAAKNKITVPSDIDYTGTPNGSKFLRDDGAFVAIPGGGDMLAANNLSDVASIDQARTNLAAFGVIRIQQFASSGTYTPHANMIYADIMCQAAGGGGAYVGTYAGSSIGTGGGGGGEWAKRVVSRAMVGASQSVTVGAGGSGGTSGTPSGGVGGDTSVGMLCVAKGGGVSPGNNAPGPGGTGGTGDVLVPGRPGNIGVMASGSPPSFPAINGIGGSSVLGAGVPQAGTTTAQNGGSGTGYGAGGNGGATYNAAGSAANGGPGKDGCVVIIEYCSQ